MHEPSWVISCARAVSYLECMNRFIFLFSVHDEVLSPNCSSSPSDSQSNIILCCATRNTARLSFMKIIYTYHKSNIILFEEKDLQSLIEYVLKFIMLLWQAFSLIWKGNVSRKEAIIGLVKKQYNVNVICFMGWCH